MAKDEKSISGNLIVLAENICKKWHINDVELLDEIKNGKLSVLFCSKAPRKNPSGEVLYLCREGAGLNIYCYNDFNSGNSYCDLDGVYLYRDEIEKYEKQNQHLLLDLADGNNGSDDKLVDNNKCYTSFLQLKDAAGLSIAQLRDVIIKYEIQVYHEEQDEWNKILVMPYDLKANGFQDWIINEGLFDMLDIRPHKNEWTELHRLFTEDQKAYDSINCYVSELEHQLQELRHENERLKAGGGEVVLPAPVCENCQADQDAKQRLANLEVTNRDLQSRLDAAQAGRPRWLPSSIALFQASKQVIESDREDWIKDEFFSLAESLYVNPGDNQGVLGEAREEAWKALPKQFKAGPGNQKNKGNPIKE